VSLRLDEGVENLPEEHRRNNMDRGGPVGGVWGFWAEGGASHLLRVLAARVEKHIKEGNSRHHFSGLLKETTARRHAGGKNEIKGIDGSNFQKPRQGERVMVRKRYKWKISNIPVNREEKTIARRASRDEQNKRATVGSQRRNPR